MRCVAPNSLHENPNSKAALFAVGAALLSFIPFADGLKAGRKAGKEAAEEAAQKTVGRTDPFRDKIDELVASSKPSQRDLGNRPTRPTEVPIGTITKSNSPIWKDMEPFRGQTKSNGLSGKKRQYYEWDHTHNDIEVYDNAGRHLGSMDPTTGQMIKPAVKGRTIDLE
jgi:hypothetical protein